MGTRPPADSLENLLPGPAGLSASNGLEGTQVAGGSGRLQETEVVQSIETRESVTSDTMSEVSEVSDKVDSDSPPNMGDDNEVVIVEESPHTLMLTDFQKLSRLEDSEQLQSELSLTGPRSRRDSLTWTGV